MTAATTITDPKSGAKLWNIGNFIERIPAELEFVIDGFLPTQTLSMLVAKPKVGKSTLARCLAAAVSGTRDTFLGRKVTNGRVIYLALEEGHRTVGGHFRQIVETPYPEPKDNQLWVFCDPPYMLGEDPLEKLEGWIDHLMPDLIVIDPLFRFWRLMEAPDYGPVTNWMQPLIDMAHEGQAHILLVHHAGKAESADKIDAPLGSTALAGSVDIVLTMKKDRNSGERSLYAEGRDIDEYPETLLEMDSNRWITATGTKAEAKAKAHFETVREEVINYLDGCRTQWKGIGDVQKGTKRRRGDVITQLRWLANEGDIEHKGSGNPGDPVRYRIG